MERMEITTTTLLCMFPLPGCHNDGKYQKQTRQIKEFEGATKPFFQNKFVRNNLLPHQ